ncbi:MAG: hypothetical protein HYZ89_01205 [Candidatus Omnitrophica bacterium]|nr:hypothetical protein [Candidatus Omnitrophota bacterium]
MKTKIVSGIYENGTIRLHTTIKVGRKLSLRNQARVRFLLEFPTQRSTAFQTFGILRVSKRLARLIAESPEFSVLNG